MLLLVTELVCHCWLPSLYFAAGYRALCYCWLLNLSLLVTELVCHCWLLSFYVTTSNRAIMSVLATELCVTAGHF